MRRIICLLVVYLAFGVGGCARAPQPLPETPKVIEITNPEEVSIPLIYTWDVDKAELITQDGVSLAILGVQLSPSDTKVFYSLAGGDAGRLLERTSLEIIDDLGGVQPLIALVPVGVLGELELGFMNFAARPGGVQELFLLIGDKSGKAQGQKSLLASFDGPPEEDRLDATWILGRGEIEQAGYLVDVNLWSAGDLSVDGASAAPGTALPMPDAAAAPLPRSTWIELPSGVIVIRDISFEAQRLSDKTTYRLSAQLLSDGSAIVRGAGFLVIPTPLLVAAPTQAPAAYP
jgi:hypothetical protein